MASEATGVRQQVRVGDESADEQRSQIPPKLHRNYRFDQPGDLNYEGSWLTKAKQNVEAIELLKVLEAEWRLAAPVEQRALAKLVPFSDNRRRSIKHLP